jgi:multiple sugar transport system permease protein
MVAAAPRRIGDGAMSPTGRRRWGNPAYWFLAPALSAIGLFFFIPVMAAVFLSLTDFDIYAVADLGNLRFIGSGNYVSLARDPLFWVALRNTLYFVIVGGPLSVAVSLGAALLVTARLARARSLFRTVFFLPVVTTLVAVAVVWRYLYHVRAGLLSYGFSLAGVSPIDWLGDPFWAMPAIIILAIWKNFGFNMVIFVAGLQSVPERLYEAARIDGAGRWQQFRYVTVPMLAPTFAFVGLITLIGYFQLFAEPYVMTQGGPAHATLSIVLLMYEHGFRWWNMGYAAAVAFVLFALILGVSAAAMRLRSASSRASSAEAMEPAR